MEGTKAQRSLAGLLRGLLYHILDTAPELTPIAFPEMWELASTHDAAITTVPDSQVGIAFNRLMANPRTYYFQVLHI